MSDIEPDHRGVEPASCPGSQSRMTDVSDAARGVSWLAAMAGVREKVREFALSLPGAFEDHPWGEDVAKVRGKIFVFLGTSGSPTGRITVKLEESHAHALSIPGAEPTSYGLGKAGWVTVPMRAEGITLPVLRDWVEESYRIVAPKQLVGELDGSAATQ